MQWTLFFLSVPKVVDAWSSGGHDGMSLLQADYRTFVDANPTSNEELTLVSRAPMHVRIPPPSPNETSDQRRRRRSAGKIGKRLVKGALHRTTQILKKDLQKTLQKRGVAAQASLEAMRTSAMDELFLWKSAQASQVLIMYQFVMLWKFMLILGIFLTLGASGTVFYHKVWGKRVLDSQGLNLQILLVFELLLLCLGAECAHTHLTIHPGPKHVILALRDSLEAYLLILVFCAKPCMVLEYACMGRVREAVDTDSSLVSVEAVRPPSQEDAENRLLKTSACWKRMIGVLTVRVIFHIVMRLTFANSWFLWKIVSLALLGVAVFDGTKTTRGVQDLLRKLFGVEPALDPLQIAMAVLLILSQIQDVTLFMILGPGSAQNALATLYLLEVVGTILACGLVIVKDSFDDLTQYHCEEETTSCSKIFILLLKPYALLVLRDPRVGVQSLPLRPQKESLPWNASLPIWEMTEQEKLLDTAGGLVVRNRWRGVLLDLFSTKVRSKLLSVIVITIGMNHCVYLFPKMSSFIQNYYRGSPGSQSIVLAVGQMLVASGIWLACGVTLLGNNAFFPRSWLSLAFVALGCNAVYCCQYVFVATHNGDSLEDLTNLWLDLFLGLASCIGMCIIARLVFVPQGATCFHSSQQRATEYVKLLLDTFPKNTSANKHAKHLKRLFHKLDDFPQLLLVGAAAAMPVVLALSFIAMYCGKEILRHARIAQCFTHLLSGDISQKDLVWALDYDYDRQISPQEAGLTTLLQFVGVSEISTVIGMLWQQADSNKNGVLDEAEVGAYMHRVKATKATVDCWQTGDPLLASELLLDKLDTDHNGSLNVNELEPENLVMMLQAVGASQEKLLSKSLVRLWIGADFNNDGELNMEELADFFTAAKQRALKLRTTVQGVNVLLMRAGDVAEPGKSIHAAKEMLEILGNSSHSSEEALNTIEAAMYPMGSPTLSAKVESWRKDRSQVPKGWGPGHEKAWGKAIAHLIKDIRPELQRIQNRSFVFLDALKDPPNAGARELFLRLDSNNNSRLEVDEMGIRGALGIVHPDLMTLVDDLLVTSGASNVSSIESQGLSKDEVELVLEQVGNVLLNHFGDLDHDGVQTSKDLAVLVNAAAQKLRSSSVSSTQHPPGIALVMRRAVKPLPKTFLLQHKTQLKSVSSRFEAFTSGLIASVAQQLVRFNLNLLEAFLYVSALAAFAFGLFIIAMPFRGYRRLYEHMQTANKNFKGHDCMKEVEERMDFACFFPGIIFSTVLTGMATVFLIIFLILVVLSRPEFWAWLWGARLWLGWLGCTVLIQLLIMRRLVLDRYCQEQGDIVRPRLFAWVYVVFVVLNFALGAFAAILRVIAMLPFLFVQIHRLDHSALDEEFVDMDIGFASFLTLTRVDYRQSNPIKSCFVEALNPGVHRIYGGVPAEESTMTSKDVKQKRNRNRWWLALLLSKNRSLLQHRKQGT